MAALKLVAESDISSACDEESSYHGNEQEIIHDGKN